MCKTYLEIERTKLNLLIEQEASPDEILYQSQVVDDRIIALMRNKGGSILEKQAAISNLNKLKELYLKAKTTGDTNGMYMTHGELIGTLNAYSDCGVLTYEESFEFLNEIK